MARALDIRTVFLRLRRLLVPAIIPAGVFLASAAILLCCPQWLVAGAGEQRRLSWAFFLVVPGGVIAAFFAFRLDPEWLGVKRAAVLVSTVFPAIAAAGDAVSATMMAGWCGEGPLFLHQLGLTLSLACVGVVLGALMLAGALFVGVLVWRRQQREEAQGLAADARN